MKLKLQNIIHIRVQAQDWRL